MTTEQFIAWLEGFAEAIDGAPSAEQFAKVMAKAREVSQPGALKWPAGVRGLPNLALYGETTERDCISVSDVVDAAKLGNGGL